jgi:hypothetical protein
MAKDLLLGKTKRDFSRNSAVDLMGSIPEGASGYAPTTWWAKDKAEKKVQDLMKSGGLFGMSLPRDLAEQEAMKYFRKNTIGILS